MKVVYKTVVASIKDAVHSAEQAGRTIDHIQLSYAEAEAMREEMISLITPGWIHRGSVMYFAGEEIGYLSGVRLVVAP